MRYRKSLKTRSSWESWANGKRRPRENFASRVSDAATCRIQRVTEGEEICKRPEPDRLPRGVIGGGFDWDLRPIRRRLLELQLIPQDVSRRALSHGFARKQESACDAEGGNNEHATMVPSRRTPLNGMATDFPASCSAHNGPLLCKSSAIRRIRNHHFHVVGAVTAEKGSPSGGHGIKWADGKYWMAVPAASKLFLMEPESGAIIRSIPGPGTTQRTHGIAI